MVKTMITKSRMLGYNKISKTILTAIVCCGLSFASVDSKAEIATVTGGAVTYLQAGYFLKDIENNLHRYRTAMIVMSNTDNRDDFLVNRDELFKSREQLSFAINTLQEYTRSPVFAESNELIQLISNILVKCEPYPNNQNEIVSFKSKIKDAREDLLEIFTNLKTAETIISQASLSPEQETLLEKLKFARADYETLLKNYFNAKAVSQIDEIIPQLQESFTAFNNIISEAEVAFPQVKSVYDTAKDFIQKAFAEKGAGTTYYLYLKKKDEQTVIDSYFKRSFNESNKVIKELQTKLSVRVPFIS
jgi:hypothetical protein